MQITVNTRTRVTTTPSSGRRGTMILGSALLIAGLIFLLGLRLDFARYAFTAFQWQRANGTVVNPGRLWNPTIQFVAGDGSLQAFNENYGQLCGHRSLCRRRNFTFGEIVPVVYDPAAPSRAFVRDFALYSTIFEWFCEAFFLFLLLLLMVNLILGGSGNVSIQIGSPPNLE
jgi:hypothetical protein